MPAPNRSMQPCDLSLAVLRGDRGPQGLQRGVTGSCMSPFITDQLRSPEEAPADTEGEPSQGCWEDQINALCRNASTPQAGRPPATGMGPTHAPHSTPAFLPPPPLL